MGTQILVVAKGDTVVNKFEQTSIQAALNLKDFLEETGDYKQVLIFQRAGSVGPTGEWVEMPGIEC